MRIKKETAYQVVDGQVVAVPGRGDRVYLMDAAATALWERLVEGVDAGDLGEEELRYAQCLAGKGLAEKDGTVEGPEGHAWIISEEPVEVMAALCDSSRIGSGGTNPGQGQGPPITPPGHAGKCRTFGSCQLAFE
ncbi:MAG: hypothetical protein JW909_08655 [Planctomycetes bacterium]|nr:hypothetical protein [Planctomycetota bacterium]